jgi:hypothetical protein
VEDQDLPLWTEKRKGEFSVDAGSDFGKDLGRSEGWLVRFEEGKKLHIVAVVDVVVRMLVPHLIMWWHPCFSIKTRLGTRKEDGEEA